jgi:phosphoribosyl 1,2-cyclic phosphodiesterase
MATDRPQQTLLFPMPSPGPAAGTSDITSPKSRIRTGTIKAPNTKADSGKFGSAKIKSGNGPVNDASGRAANRIRFCVLGSGSGGNSSVMSLGGRNVLIDAGLGPRTISKRLGQIDINPIDLDAIFVTHLDQDHFRPHWIASALKWGITVFVHQWHLKALSKCKGYLGLCRAGLVRDFDSKPFEPWPGVQVRSVRLPHDNKGTTGYRFDTACGSVALATDLGQVPDEMIECFAGVDLLAIESNYDPQMQISSSRPAFLKDRVMGGRGHLSNQQAFEAVCEISERSISGNPRHIVLLHQSSQCNDPREIKRVFGQDEKIRRRIVLSHQRRRTPWIDISPLKPLRRSQMRLSF